MMKNLLTIIFFFLLASTVPNQAFCFDDLRAAMDSLEIEDADNKLDEASFHRFNTSTDNMLRLDLGALSKHTDFAAKLTEDFLFKNNQIRISKFYPNPVHNFANIDYELIESIKAKVRIQNLVGGIEAEYNLAKDNNRVTINAYDFDPGTYFYTLFIDDDPIVALKLLIKHD